MLVFSDEFNTDGRTFYPGDDPYWEAVDLHYWQTNNLEWFVALYLEISTINIPSPGTIPRKSQPRTATWKLNYNKLTLLPTMISNTGEG
jgi:hypothetical protein